MKPGRKQFSGTVLFVTLCMLGMLGLCSKIYGQAILSPYTGVLLSRQQRAAEQLRTKAASAETSAATLTASADRKVGLYLEISADSVQTSIEQAGFSPVRHADSILTLQCFLSEIDRLSRIPGILRIQISGNVKRRLHRTAQQVGALTAYNGIGDPKQYYNGEGVIVAVLDFGFDLTHPAFMDADGNSRVVRVWDQTGNGTPPAGYTYGTEYSGSALAQKTYTSDEYHGTHVTGIAAGRGVGSDRKFQGMAPHASLVLVELGMMESDLSDAIKYVFDYATSVNKPAVINLSLGTHLGPHDGTSTFDKLIDQYSGPGKIIVGAAGNEGDYNMHISKVFNEPAKLHTVMDFYETGNTENINYVDVWTKKYAEHFDWRVYVYDLAGNKLGQTPLRTTATSRTMDQVLIGGVIIKVESQTVKEESNRRNNFFMAVENPRMNEYLIVLEIEAANDTLHLWNLAYDQSGMSFSTLPSVTGMQWVAGDNACSVGEIGGTAKRIITVGAIDPDTENRTSYSSRGPTRDGRIKPDIMAPGHYIAAPINYYAKDKPTAYYSFPFRNKSYTYGKVAGTSMATPHVTGAVALFLQREPQLSPEAVKIILAENAAIPAGQQGALPNFDWGNGLLRVLTYLLTPAPQIELTRFTLFPNPSTGVFTIRGPVYTHYTVEVYSMQGNKVYQGEGEGESTHRITCVAGHYAVILRTASRTESHLLLIGRPK